MKGPPARTARREKANGKELQRQAQPTASQLPLTGLLRPEAETVTEDCNSKDTAGWRRLENDLGGKQKLPAHAVPSLGRGVKCSDRRAVQRFHCEITQARA